MKLLDTNVVTRIRNGDPTVLRRFAVEAAQSFVSTLTLEEVLVNGCFAETNRIRGGRSGSNLQTAHGRFLEAVQQLAAFNLVSYTQEAEAVYKTFASARQRGMDGRIAAHALTLGYTLITENERDFANVPGLNIDNWAK